MTFTDDDLKRLKELLMTYVHGSNGRISIEAEEVKALLARLEAAEKACNTMKYVHKFWTKLPFAETLWNELMQWFEVAGK